MKLAKNREAGQILIWALMLLAMGPLLVVPMLKLSYSSQRYNEVTEIYTLNTYAADSGIEYAKYQIYNNPAEIITSGLDDNLVINNIDVHVTAEYMPGTAAYDIISTAARAESSVSVACSIVIDVGLFGNVVACDGNLVIDNCAFVSPDFPGESDIYTNGNIEIKGSSYVDGDAMASGEVNVIPPAVLTGVEMEGAAVMEFPAINAQLHKEKAQMGGTHDGNLTYDSGGPYDLGPLYVDGSLDINNCDIVLHGTIYVAGDVGINHCEITGFGDIIAEGKLDMNNYSLNVDIPEILPLFMSVTNHMAIRNDDYGDPGGTQAILYAPIGKIDLENVELTGSVAAEEVVCKNSIINYPAELRGRADLPGAGLDTVTYLFE